MALSILSLQDLLESDSSEEEINVLLHSFASLKSQDSSGADDVEYFLHNKAIQFEKMDLSRTHLVMSTYQSKPFIAGYFSLSPKPLVLPKRQFKKLSNNQQRRLMGIGHKTDQQSYTIPGYLLGQLGKSFSTEALKANCCSGQDLLELAYTKIREIHRLLGGKAIHLECEDHPKILDFYTRSGFSQIEDYTSDNGYCIMLKQIKHII